MDAGIPPECLYVIPDQHRINISTIRQWILDTFWDDDEPFIMQVDDDFKGLKPLMRWSTAVISRPTDIVAVFWESYISAADAGAGIFGYAHVPDPQLRFSRIPVTLRTWLRAQMGILDRSLKYDPGFYVAEDIDICLASICKNRILWRDERWAPHADLSWTFAGIAATRTEKRRQDSYVRLNSKYGNGTITTMQNYRVGGKNMNARGNRIKVNINHRVQ